jgi:hypothetical protein
MTVKPKITAARAGAELRWTSSLPGIIGGEHSFTLAATGSGTGVVQTETFQGLLARFSGKTFANAEASFQAPQRSSQATRRSTSAPACCTGELT